MINQCYFKGKITTLDKVKISPYDIGLLRGYGVFDVMCTENGKPFLLNEHWKRFQSSAKELSLIVPIKKEEYCKIVEKLLKLNNFSKSNIRTVLTGGESADGFALERGKENFLILIEKFHNFPEAIYQRGAKVITADYERFFPQAKVTNYVVAIQNQDRKIKGKALEIFYLKNGIALEASTSNFFIVKGRRIITAKDGILLGITRNLVIDLAIRAGIKVVEREIKTKELFKADEVFLTATNKKIVPVIAIDGKKIGDGKVGEITKILMKEFQKFVREY